MLGFPSYSHMSSWHRSIKTPGEIRNLLESVADRIERKVQKEAFDLRSAKAKQENTPLEHTYYMPW